MDYVALIKRIINKGKFDADKLKDQINVLYLDESTNVDKDARDELMTLIDGHAPEVDIAELIEHKVEESKEILAKFLLEHPLFSNCKYEDGRYYNVTSEKQQQLTSKLMVYQVYVTQGLPYELTWNSTNEQCEPWTYEELVTLSLQIDAYVTPLVSQQQHIEVEMRACKTKAELDAIEIVYTIGQ